MKPLGLELLAFGFDKIFRSDVPMFASICSPQFRTFDSGVFKSSWCVPHRSYLWFTGEIFLVNYYFLLNKIILAHTRLKETKAGRAAKKKNKKKRPHR